MRRLLFLVGGVVFVDTMFFAALTPLLINVAWAPGQALGAVGGGALADVTSDTVPYLMLACASLITFAVLWRSASSS